MGRDAFPPAGLGSGNSGAARPTIRTPNTACRRSRTALEVDVPTIITARRLVTDIGSVEFPVLIVGDDGTLSDISSDPTALAREEDTLTSAFFDVHIHGGMGHDVMSASRAQMTELQRFLATRGVANYLPTTVTAQVDATLHALEA